MDLRERVEDRAGRLVELDRAADVERAVERLLRAHEIAEPDANLPERRQRDGEAMPRAMGLVQRDAAFRQRERLLVPVLQHHHVGLVAADRRDHIVGMHHRGEPLGMAQRGHALVVEAQLRERNARQRVHQREVAPVAGRMQRRRGLRDVLAHDGDVSDLPVALPELVVREADEPRIVRGFGLLECAPVHRDRARLIAARRGQPSVQPPERGKAPWRDGVAERVAVRIAERVLERVAKGVLLDGDRVAV